MVKIDKNTYRAESWIDLQNYMFDVYESDKDRYRSKYAYRGVANLNYGLETSLQRIGRQPSTVEHHLIRNFQKYSPINTLIDNYNNIWNWIALGQHHGLPTRLLDWTFSPNVALHFMTDNISTFNVDGVIWMVDFIEMKNHLPKKLQNTFSKKKTLSFTSTELKTEIGETIEEVVEFNKNNGDGLIFFEPPSIDDRIVNQFALFSFMLNPDTDKLDWLKKHPKLYKKIIIPHSLKWEIRDKLDQANITERIIYPGLDGISKWLSRWYSEKDITKKWEL
ncbi:FRG domain-containing protein [Flavivirga aquimarina]|uniref:FRG domain-containing protein n=1 Tax=Flavivirga aquimarina TaxID=2027862 RepID=A0ABT8WG89_9FLAO|nr:FRG domain-containing protein [Flavivirga aquimarina]MDO5972012.1 FRG domain-containing protein [Flavivirga aquimarina]